MNILTVDYAASDQDRTILTNSLRVTGFAVLVNTPLEHSVLARLYADWAAFFARDDKVDYPYDPDLPEGYSPFRGDDGRLIDVKECFYFRPEGPCPKQLRQVTELVHNTLFSIAQNLMDGLVECAGPATRAVLKTELNRGQRSSVLRVIHYLPMTSSPGFQNNLDGHPVRLAAHRDRNLLTILPAATAPGLEIMDNDGNWHQTTCDSRSTIVNAGDQLQHLSRGFYRSTQHRVRNSIAELASSRYATALFLA
jgi:isopenicillin N synthase-like dioxygenase